VVGGFKVLVTPVAEASIERIYDYYELEVSRSVAQRIKNEILKEILMLKILPERKSLLRAKKKYNPVMRFAQKMSFKIIFQVYTEVQEVVVLEIIHDKENPEKWESI
jgi:plasmid stabilization system protein ParE